MGPIVRTLFLGLALSVAASGPAGGAEAPPPERLIPFTLRADKVILPVAVGASRELKIILDTGMSFDGLMLFDSAALAGVELKHPVQARVGGAGAGPAQTAIMADSMFFRMGAVDFANQRIVALDGELMRGFTNDGVCGQSLFGHFAVELDYARSVIVLHDPGAFSPDTSWAALPISFKAHGVPWLEVAVSIAGTDSVALACYIDLASSESLELLTCADMPFALPAEREPYYLGRGLSGDIEGERGRVAWVQVGPHRIADVTVAIAPEEMRSKQPGAEAIVGNGMLCRFHCVFDYAAARLYLKPLDSANRARRQ